MKQRPTRNLNVISYNLVTFGAIFMKFSPKCNKKSDIGEYVLKIWEFLSLFVKKQGSITGPKFAIGKSLPIYEIQ